jgi:hypothetical protein
VRLSRLGVLASAGAITLACYGVATPAQASPLIATDVSLTGPTVSAVSLQPLTLTAKVSASDDSIAGVGGTVTFTATPDQGGSPQHIGAVGYWPQPASPATYSVNLAQLSLTPGLYALSANFEPNDYEVYAPSVSQAIPLVVNAPAAGPTDIYNVTEGVQSGGGGLDAVYGANSPLGVASHAQSFEWPGPGRLDLNSIRLLLFANSGTGQMTVSITPDEPSPFGQTATCSPACLDSQPDLSRPLVTVPTTASSTQPSWTAQLDLGNTWIDPGRYWVVMQSADPSGLGGWYQSGLTNSACGPQAHFSDTSAPDWETHQFTDGACPQMELQATWPAEQSVSSDPPCSQPGSGCLDEQSVQTEVPVGTIVINTPYTAANPLNLGNMALNAAGTEYNVSGAFKCITVTDTTAGHLPWTAQALASPLTDQNPPTGATVTTINSENVGLTGFTEPTSGDSPTCTDTQNYTGSVATTDNPAAVPAVPAADTGSTGLGGSTSHTFAQGSGGDGTTTIDGTLSINAPTSNAAGTYTGTITFTVSD